MRSTGSKLQMDWATGAWCLVALGWLVAVGLASGSGALAAPGGPPAPPATAAADTLRRAAVREGWPDTRAGELAFGWVRAFSTGEAAMREFLSKHLAAKSLQSKSIPQRVERYQDLHEQYGRLELVSVVKSSADKLTVKLMAEDSKVREFDFAIEAAAPRKLESVSVRGFAHMHGGQGH